MENNGAMNVTVNFDNINFEDMKLMINDENETFGVAFKRYMDESKVKVSKLGDITGINATLITKYRTDERTPSLGQLIACCVGLRLHINRSEYLLKLCGYSLNNSTLHGLYKIFIGMCYVGNLTVRDCNNVLEKYGFDTLDKQ